MRCEALTDRTQIEMNRIAHTSQLIPKTFYTHELYPKRSKAKHQPKAVFLAAQHGHWQRSPWFAAYPRPLFQKRD